MKGIESQTVLQWNGMRWLILAICLFHTSISIANAATINVTANATDLLMTDSSCSLREAITNINNGADTFLDCMATGTYAVDDTINLPSGTYTNAINNTSALEEDANANGDLDLLKSVAIAGAGKTTTIIDANGVLTSDRVLDVVNPVAAVAISGLTIQSGATLSVGGGIRNNGTLTITDCTIKNNSAQFAGSPQSGGGITNGGLLTITKTTVNSNVAGTSGGGIFNGAGGVISISDSTISSNSVANATNSGGGGMSNLGQIEITNSTISGNTVGNNYGGGIVNNSTAQLVIRNSTITGNTADNAGGGGIKISGGTVDLFNTIVADQLSGGDCLNSGGTLTTPLNNLDSDGTCGVGILSNQDPLLGPLQNNSGPTMTHALLPGSPAIGAGDAANCASAPVNGLDQRGITRPQGGKCDIGAYEKKKTSFYVIPLPSGKTVSFGL